MYTDASQNCKFNLKFADYCYCGPIKYTNFPITENIKI